MDGLLIISLTTRTVLTYNTIVFISHILSIGSEFGDMTIHALLVFGDHTPLFICFIIHHQNFPYRVFSHILKRLETTSFKNIKYRDFRGPIINSQYHGY